ncbi:MAG: hypothetical protein JKX69_09720 [Rhodobacteraceae bacterium]|nr:hypothetical protein [Paracoccaceae bacterium]
MPGHCAHVYSTSTGPRRLLNADCLTQHYALAGRLPLSCAVTVRVAGGFESGFDPTCLRNVGYRAHRY